MGGSGDLTLTDIESSSTFTVDGSSYGGNIDVANISGVGKLHSSLDLKEILVLKQY